MIPYRHHEHKLLFAIGLTTLSISSGMITNYATRSYPTDLPPQNDRSLTHRSIILGDGESSDQLVLRNDLINYLTGNTQYCIIALNPKHNDLLNKGNPKPILLIILHPDISTKHKYMTFLLSNNMPKTFTYVDVRASERRFCSNGLLLSRNQCREFEYDLP